MWGAAVCQSNCCAMWGISVSKILNNELDLLVHLSYCEGRDRGRGGPIPALSGGRSVTWRNRKRRSSRRRRRSGESPPPSWSSSACVAWPAERSPHSSERSPRACLY
ncbi:UNVERIFIED_CONTAM: hypothetical protein FKN15_022676 [Acipenser sinensis]